MAKLAQKQVIRLGDPFYSMPAKLNSHLWLSRHGVYYIRIERNGKECRKSLRTRDPSVARAAAYRFGATIATMSGNYKNINVFGGPEIVTDEVYEQVRSEMLAEKMRSQARITAAAQALAGVATATTESTQKPLQNIQSQTLKAALKDYKEEAGAGKSEVTWATYQSAFNKLLSGLGSTTPIHTITGEQFSRWRRNTLDGKLSPATIDKDLRGLRGLFKWAIKRNRHPGPNPVEQPDQTAGIRAAEVRKYELARQPFSAADLSKIVPAVLAAPKPCGFWIPLIVLLTGARPGEIAEMLLDDIKQLSDGTLSMQIRKAKTVGSYRTIPLPQQLACLLDYIKDVRRTNPDAIHLFPHLVAHGKNGRWNNASKDFSALKSALGFERGQDCYSLRHTWITMSDRTIMSVNAARQYTGHIQDKNDAHNGYVKALGFDELATLVLPKIDFEVWPGYVMPQIIYSIGQFDAVLLAPPKIKRVLRIKHKRTPRIKL